MKGTRKPIVKICCIKSIEEANSAIRYGAEAIGLVSEMPSGPGIINEKLIKEISFFAKAKAETFLLTSKTSVEEIIAQHTKVNTTTIQIVDKVEIGDYHTFRQELPNVKIVQVIHVQDENSIKEAVEVSLKVDAILLDSGNPNSKIKTLGGTGKTHNWEISRTIREEINIPVFLAGGLNSHNIKKAIQTVQPFGVDLCSSVRTNGKLDLNKLKELFLALA